MRKQTIFEQPGAMCLMWYECRACGRRERIWNSRPRVTPFMVLCPTCEGNMKHVDWDEDEFAPNHKPQPGERIFVDMSRDTHMHIVKESIERWWDHSHQPMRDYYKNKEEALEALMRTWEWDAPDLMVVPEPPKN